jgi:hypothetical protein
MNTPLDKCKIYYTKSNYLTFNDAVVLKKYSYLGDGCWWSSASFEGKSRPFEMTGWRKLDSDTITTIFEETLISKEEYEDLLLIEELKK